LKKVVVIRGKMKTSGGNWGQNGKKVVSRGKMKTSGGN
jgi:hypothetical protein